MGKNDLNERKKAKKVLEKSHEKLEELVEKRTLELAKSQEELQKASKYTRSLIEANLDPLVTISPEGKITDVNTAVEMVTGYNRIQIIGTDFSNYFTNPEKAKAGYEEVFKQGFVKNYPLEIQHIDGHVTPVMYNASVYRDENDNVVGVFAAARDITELKRAHDDLLISERRLNNIIDGSPISQFVIDKDHKIIYWNDALEKNSGIRAKEVIGKAEQWRAFYNEKRPCLADLLVDESQGEILKWYRGNAKKSKFVKDAYEAIDFFPAMGEDGKWLFFTAAPIRDFEGRVMGAVETLEDITERKKAEIALQKSEERFRAVAESAVDAIVTTDANGDIIFFNNSLETIFGYQKDELKRKPLTLLMPERFKDKYLDELKRFKFTGEHKLIGRIATTTGLKRDGTEFPFEMSLSSWRSGENIYFTSIIRDLTEKKRAEDALKESEEKYRTIIETAQEGVWIIDENANTTYVNQGMAEMLGYSADEMMDKSLFDFMDDEGKVDAEEKMERRREGIKEVHDFRFLHKDGSSVWAMISTNPIFDKNGEFSGALGMLSDITHRKQMEVQIKESLEEKEMLLKEVHHRVKNNLAVISSLLNLQSDYIRDKEDLELFRESQTRAKTMALIHERLYQSRDLKNIDFGEYMHTLINDLFNTYSVDPGLVKLNMSLENVMLDINTSIPLGLIVNELVSNSMKYAFPDGRKGIIKINFESGKDQYVLCVSDNGVGLPEGIDFKNTDSLGLQLVNSLTNQIEGEIELDKSHGTEFKITFKDII
ncbi:MAG: PAS domain S-box protein [Methanobacterium sp.]|uniref:PAS domain S-box protein n=1 Tax=Methanobacterium sp. TaxID=2164 RepID=UPI003D649B20|nr:PAS domain S-box protein [Methanobacterium sp.]